jgi:hypothetical protein
VTTSHPADGDLLAVARTAASYEIRVRGRVSPAVLAAFEGMSAEVEPVETILHGPVGDQEELHSLLERVQELGLELVEVRRLHDEGEQ